MEGRIVASTYFFDDGDYSKITFGEIMDISARRTLHGRIDVLYVNKEFVLQNGHGGRLRAAEPLPQADRPRPRTGKALRHGTPLPPPGAH